PSRALSLPRRVLQRLALFSSTTAVASLVAACGGIGLPPPGATPTSQLFARGIDEITQLYIHPVSREKTVVAGAAPLAWPDARLHAMLGGEIRDRDQLTLSYQGQPVASYRLEEDSSGQSGGKTLADIVGAAKQASPRVAALPQEAIDRVVFDGMTGTLD